MGIAVSAEILQRALNDPNAKESTGLTRQQADAILSMQLQRLTGLEADKLAQEYAGLKENIANYEAILADEKKILATGSGRPDRAQEQVCRRAPQRDLRRRGGRLRQGSAAPRREHGRHRHP